jgi:hypothetical protein
MQPSSSSRNSTNRPTVPTAARRSRSTPPSSNSTPTPQPSSRKSRSTPSADAANPRSWSRSNPNSRRLSPFSSTTKNTRLPSKSRRNTPHSKNVQSQTYRRQHRPQTTCRLRGPCSHNSRGGGERTLRDSEAQLDLPAGGEGGRQHFPANPFPDSPPALLFLPVQPQKPHPRAEGRRGSLAHRQSPSQGRQGAAADGGVRVRGRSGASIGEGRSGVHGARCSGRRGATADAAGVALAVHAAAAGRAVLMITVYSNE